MAYAMLKELIEICKEKDAVVRIVYGTESHECNQYDILSLLRIYDKIEVVKYAKEELKKKAEKEEKSAKGNKSDKEEKLKEE